MLGGETALRKIFLWRDCLKSLPKFKSLATCSFNIGNSMLLWKGKWSDGDFLRHRWPHLFSFEKDENVKVQRENGSVELSELFYYLSQ